MAEAHFTGMTTNERLYAANLLDAFDQAARRRDRARMVEVLGKVQLADQAEKIADAILSEPQRYGF